MAASRPRDKRTRWPGVSVRHRAGCPANRNKRCRCEPTYVARVWDRARHRSVPSPTFANPLDAVSWQQQKRESLRQAAALATATALADASPDAQPGLPISLEQLAALLGIKLVIESPDTQGGFAVLTPTSPLLNSPAPRAQPSTDPAGRAEGEHPPSLFAPAAAPGASAAERPTGITVREGSERFVKAMQDDTALNKKGKPYKPGSRRTIEGALAGRIAAELGSVPINGVTRGQVQTLIDEMVAERLSGSRVRNVLNALRSLYNYAIPRDLAETSPVRDIVLPAIGEKRRERIALPGEFLLLLGALEPADAVPFALAAYATARSQEALNLAWPEVDFAAGMVYLADEEDYAKSEAARRPFPLIAPLRAILETEHARQGHPTAGLVCPGRKTGGRNSGLLSTHALYTRADLRWKARKLEPIRLQDCRHTASSWMRAAGIELKVRSVLMGHASTASTDRGPGSITDDRPPFVGPPRVRGWWVGRVGR